MLVVKLAKQILCLEILWIELGRGEQVAHLLLVVFLLERHVAKQEIDAWTGRILMIGDLKVLARLREVPQLQRYGAFLG
jgi:hypothetical protein